MAPALPLVPRPQSISHRSGPELLCPYPLTLHGLTPMSFLVLLSPASILSGEGTPSPSWPPLRGPHCCRRSMWVLCALQAGRCQCQPWSAVQAGPASISGSAAAVAQRCLGPMALPARAELALHTPGHVSEQWPWYSCAMGLAGRPDKASTNPSLCICLPCLAVQSGAMQAASVQEQPLLKQNNLQKYRYSPCPRPDLAKEEQGSRPGQGLAQPHGAFGHGGCVHPNSGSQACSQPQGHSPPPPPPHSKRCSHRQRFPPSRARSCPSPVLGQGTRWGGGCAPPRRELSTEEHWHEGSATPGSAEG